MTESNPQVVTGLTEATIADLERESAQSILQYLKSNDSNMLKRAQVAQGTLGSLTRRRATDNARDALMFQMARSLTNDPVQLAEYIRVTQPHAPLLKAIPPATVPSGAQPGDAALGMATRSNAMRGS